MTENAEKIKSEKMVKMEELRKQLADLELETEVSKPSSKVNETVNDEEDEDEDDTVERGAGTRTSRGAVDLSTPRRERTEKQKQAFIKAQETRLKKAEERKKEKALKDQEEKEELEKKLIDKAIKVKKKQIKKMQVIEQLSDDDTPIEKLKPIIRKKEIIPEKPKLRFV